MPGGLTALYEGVPGPLVWTFALELAVVAASFLWVSVLFVRALRAGKSLPDAPGRVPDDLLWVFVVPALDEEATILDSVRRLGAVDAPNRVVLVVDDGSTDRTPELLASLDEPGLVVLRRRPPHARRGKADALNAAWKHLDAHVLAQEPYAGWPRDRVVVAVVDADGRLDPQAPRYVSAWLEDARVAGVQLLVRIYNRGSVLTRFQHLEFAIYGQLFQLGRNAWGTAGLGGNGQFTRLSALDAIADAEGPWRDRLTEDQDLGLRLVAAGLRCVQETRATVEQQGLSSPARLYRQRTRWAQGNLQALAGHLALPFRARLPLAARVDLLAYLLLPAQQLVVAAGLVATAALWLFWDVPLVPASALAVALFVALGFGGPVLGPVAALRGRPLGALAALPLALPYASYAWLTFPALVRAAARQLTGRTGWAKTAREPIGDPAPADR